MKAFSKTLLSSLTTGVLLISSPLQAADYTVTVTNLTQGIHFTPILLAAHDNSTQLFKSGYAASDELQAMAEGGDISGLETLVMTASGDTLANPAGGLLAPGAYTEATLMTTGTDNTQLSVVAMMLPTNDAFIGLNSVPLPTEVGTTVTWQVNAYDAGTEANDEMRGSGAPGMAGFPVPPGSPVDTGSLAAGNGGSGLANSAEGFIHIHRNVLGDTDNSAGTSDIDSRVHRWLNPVARVSVTLISE